METNFTLINSMEVFNMEQFKYNQLYCSFDIKLFMSIGQIKVKNVIMTHLEIWQ